MNPITKTTTQQVNASLFSIQSDINKTNGLVKEVQVLYNDLKAEGKIIDDNLQAQIDSINTQITTINGSLGTIGGQISAINTSLSNKVDNSRVVQTLSDSSDTIPSCAAVNGALTDYANCKIITKNIYFKQDFTGFKSGISSISYAELGVDARRIIGVSFTGDSLSIFGSSLASDTMYIHCYSGYNYGTLDQICNVIIFYQ